MNLKKVIKTLNLKLVQSCNFIMTSWMVHLNLQFQYLKVMTLLS